MSGVTAVAMLGGANSPAVAQQTPTPYTAEQCHRVRANIGGIFTRYNGKISAELVSDLKEFSRRDCDRTLPIRMMPGTKDGDAVGELRLLLSLKTAAFTPQ
jgi:hypothetical protein